MTEKTYGDITVNGEPVPQTAGITLVRSEDIPGGHAACDAEIARLRALVAEIIAAIGRGKTIYATTVTGWQQRGGLEETP